MLYEFKDIDVPVHPIIRKPVRWTGDKYVIVVPEKVLEVGE